MTASTTAVVGAMGHELNWSKPQDPTRRVWWSEETMFGGKVTGSLRTIAHLDWMSIRARKHFGKNIVVIQSAYNKTVEASAGTHDFDACLDWYIPGVPWWTMQRFGRAHGDGCWYRHPPSFPNHIHGFTLPVQRTFRTNVGVYIDGGLSLYGHIVASSQLDDYYRHAFGLSGLHTTGSDRSWFPRNIDATIFNLGTYVLNQRKQH